MIAPHQKYVVARAVAIACAGALLSCAKAEGQDQSAPSSTTSEQKTGADIAPKAEASTGPILKTSAGLANELGYVPVLEYHRIGPKEKRWTRTPENFRRDLAFLHQNNYYPVNMADVAAKRFSVPAGKKPVVLTFDDSTEGQFRFLKTPQGTWKTGPEGKKVIDPDCAVGMLDAFASKHPDFGRGATFYVLPSGFDQPGVIGEKFRYLVDTGREIGNHTWSHESLATMSAAKIESHLSKLQAFVSREVGKPTAMTTLALPFGIGPRTAATLNKVIQGGSGAGRYQHAVLLLVGANPAYSPYDKAYKATAVARIQCIDSEFKHWFKRPAGSTGTIREPWQPFVSDGDPNTVSFPLSAQKRFDPASLPSGQRPNAFDPTKVALTPSSAPTQMSQAPTAWPSQSVAISSALPSAAAAEVSSSVVTTVTTTPSAETPQARVSASPAVTPAALDRHPGYQEKLPTGGEFRNGAIRHRVAAGDSVEAIAWRYLRFTEHYTYPKLAADIRAQNGLARPLKIGEWLEIPKVRPAPPAPKTVKRDKTLPAVGVYVTGTTAGSESLWTIVKQLKAHGGNTVVFDAKDMNGAISYRSEVPLAKELKAYGGGMIHDMPKMIEGLHREGIHTVARLVLFHDTKLARKKPQFALKSKRTGGVWREGGNLAWVDPSLPAVQDYNLSLAQELINYGVDEIQFDYVRFPAQGETSDIAWQARTNSVEKHPVITAWLKRAYETLHPAGVLISADVYGVVAWDQGIDVKITGQRLEDLAKHLDVISPMLYPSHFYKNFDNLAYPPDHPEYFVGEGVKRVAKKTAGTGVVIRPWLQAFPYRIRNYGAAYVTRQIKANDAARGTGYLLWNAENDYKVGFAGISAAGHRDARAVTSPTTP